MACLLLDFEQRQTIFSVFVGHRWSSCHVPLLCRAGGQNKRQYLDDDETIFWHDQEVAHRSGGPDHPLELSSPHDGMESCSCPGCWLHYRPQTRRADPLHCPDAGGAFQLGRVPSWGDKHRDRGR